MIVLHGTWFQGALVLWGETPPDRRVALAAPPRARKGGGRRWSDSARLSPYDASAELLEAVLPPARDDDPDVARAGRRGRRERTARTGQLVAWLPTVNDCPVPSTPLVAEPPPDASPPVVAPWLVTVHRLTLEQTLDLLAACANTRVLVPGVLAGADLAFFVDLARFAAALVAREQFLPSLQRVPRDASDETAAWEARWTATIAGDDLRRLSQLVERMPDACRAMGDIEDGPPMTSPSMVARAFVDRVVDGLVRGAEGVGKAERAARAFDSVHDAWVHALTSSDPRVAGDAEELRALEAAIREWQQPVVGADTAPFRLAFRLEEPPEPDAGAWWTVRYLLQSVTDPSLFVPAGDVWKGGRQVQAAVGRAFDARAHLLRSLGQAASIAPAVAASLDAAQPAGFDIDTDAAFGFLTETAWTLQQAGFGVVLPAWWTRKGARARLSVRAQVRSQAAPTAMLTLDTLLDVDWRAALGDDLLTRAELEALARFKAPLVRLRGQWVQVSAEDRQRAIEFLKRSPKVRESDRPGVDERSGATRVTAAELVRLALGAAAPGAQVPGELPVTGIDATGWFDEVLQKLQRHEAIAERREPVGFAGELRPYQARGYSWLSFLGSWGLGACLADDMGLGKTVQALALIQHDWQAGIRKPVLLVCPVSVVGNWQKEAERFTPHLPVLVHHGQSRTKDESFRSQAASHAIVICSYGLLHRDLDMLRSASWRAVVLDEAQNIKNADTRQARAARALGADYRIALTGTPVENSVNDLWSIMEFLNPGFLGSRNAFRDAFLLPIQTSTDPEAADRLKRVTGPFILRRMKTDREIVPDLPEKQEMKVYCTLTREQASLYRAVAGEAEHELRQASGIKRKGVVLATLSKLKQVCNHPAQFLGESSPLAGRSGKLARLTEMLDEVAAGGERALVFTQFAEMGALLERHLEATFGRDVLFLHGGVPKAQRDRMVARFQSSQSNAPSASPAADLSGAPNPSSEDEAFVFVLSLKAGGTGLNLTAATHVFMFDRWWNPAVENQAIDRAFRIGQTRRVQVHKFLCAGTLEERIDEMLERKQQVAARVVGTGESWLTELSTKELREIFRLRAQAVAE